MKKETIVKVIPMTKGTFTLQQIKQVGQRSVQQ